MPVSTSAVCMLAGNDSGGECGVATARRFIMPAAPPLALAEGNVEYHSRHENPPFWYSFDYGSIHFVMLSTEHDVTPGSHQYQVRHTLPLTLCHTHFTKAYQGLSPHH